MSEPPDFEIPPEPKLPYRLWWSGFEHHATAIGYLCSTYAILEGVINRQIELTLPCSTDARRAIVDASGASIDNRCNLVLKLLSLRKPSDQFFDDFEALVVRVRNELAPERNRIVHDQWIGGEGYKQWDERAFLPKPQARTSKKLSPTKELRRELADIWDLVRRVQEVSTWMGMMSGCYGQWLLTGHFPAQPPLPSQVRKLHQKKHPHQANSKA